jgi:hypothetical protein
MRGRMARCLRELLARGLAAVAGTRRTVIRPAPPPFLIGPPGRKSWEGARIAHP